MDFSSLDETSITAPLGWQDITIDAKRRVMYEVDYTGGTPRVFKSTSIDLLQKNVKVQFLSKPCNRKNNPATYKTINQLNLMINNYHRKGMCAGIQNEQYSDVKISTGKLQDGICRPNK